MRFYTEPPGRRRLLVVNSTAYLLPSSRPWVHSRDPAFQQKPPLFQKFIMKRRIMSFFIQLSWKWLFIKETEKEHGSDLGGEGGWIVRSHDARKRLVVAWSLWKRIPRLGPGPRCGRKLWVILESCHACEGGESWDTGYGFAISGIDFASTSLKTPRLILPCRNWPCSNLPIYCFLLDLLQSQVSKLSVQIQMPSFPTEASFTGQSQAGYRGRGSAIAGQLCSWNHRDLGLSPDAVTY